MSSTSVRAEFPDPVRTPPAPRVPRYRSVLIPLSFLAPALVLLGVWVIYPAVATARRSFFADDNASDFVGFDNWDRMFSDEIVHTAIKNNVIWILVAPMAVTAFGLVLAVMVERISWASLFKIVLFMPLAISLFAVGVIWRIVYTQDPDQGLLNAGAKAIHDIFVKPGVLPGAQPGEGMSSSFTLTKPIEAGGVAKLAVTGIPPEDVPSSAKQAVNPQPEEGKITGVVWRDFKPGGGEPGVVEKQEVGIPGASVALLKDGDKAGSATTADDGSFTFDDVSGGGYTAQIAPETFREPWNGVEWLGPKLVTPMIIIAFLWTAVGFAMVIIGAGLSAIPRDVLEAARTDGGNEFQIFRRVTIPLLMPVLTVVIVTEIIGVLKLFDIIYAIAPGSVRDDATTLAFEMWRRSFSGENRFGFGAAIATFLMILFVPFLIYQVREQRRNA
jgi:alpha-glucoside transport system permease protein